MAEFTPLSVSKLSERILTRFTRRGEYSYKGMMKKKIYRMRYNCILWWLFYILFTRTLFAASILLVLSFIAVPLSLDQLLHVSFLVMFKIYILLFIIYLLIKISKNIIYIKIEERIVVFWSLVRRYTLTRDRISSVDEVHVTPHWLFGIGITHYPDSIPTKRSVLLVKTPFNTLRIELELENVFLQTFQNNFGFNTLMLKSDLKRWYYTMR